MFRGSDSAVRRDGAVSSLNSLQSRTVRKGGQDFVTTRNFSSVSSLAIIFRPLLNETDRLPQVEGAAGCVAWSEPTKQSRDRKGAVRSVWHPLPYGRGSD